MAMDIADLSIRMHFFVRFVSAINIRSYLPMYAHVHRTGGCRRCSEKASSRHSTHCEEFMRGTLSILGWATYSTQIWGFSTTLYAPCFYDKIYLPSSFIIIIIIKLTTMMCLYIVMIISHCGRNRDQKLCSEWMSRNLCILYICAMCVVCVVYTLSTSSNKNNDNLKLCGVSWLVA